ncbi:MAG: biosynthetic-type acetolactate synthase large subunit [Candidatus Brockarchaeota archaeon]|nr:biosynthetic-type acetolactate synthase large subunit [Candidatus Brockarchaeota archaeon]
MRLRGAEAVIEALKKQGVKHVFGIPGGAIMPVYDVLYDETEIRHVLVRHEQCACHAADGYARASGSVGVCMATSGPGATNLVTGLANAYMDSVPVVAFTGQVSTSFIGCDAFQEADIVGMTMPVTKHNFQVRNASEIGKVVASAFKLARSGRPAPVLVDLPKDVQASEAEIDLPEDVEIIGFKPTLNGHPLQIKKAAELLLGSERPVILAGGGVIISNASPELVALAELLGAPVVTTLLGKSSIPENHPLSLGMMGMHGRKSANYAVLQADVLLAVGTRFSDRITGNLNEFAKGTRVIHVDIDPAEIGKNVPVHLPIVGDAKSVLSDMIKAMASMIAKNRDTAWTRRIKELKERCECSLDSDAKPVDQRVLLKQLQLVLGDDDIVVTGVGRHQMFAAHFLKRFKPRTFISSGGLGTMGFGFPAAMGAKVARPDVEVFDYDGDGSFQMTGKELATCKENGIKVVAIVVRDGVLGMVYQWQDIFSKKRYSQVHLGRVPDFVKFAEAFGLKGIRVEGNEQIGPALEEAIKNDETTLVEVLVNPDVHALPMMPPGGSLSQLFGDCLEKPLLEALGPMKGW